MDYKSKQKSFLTDTRLMQGELSQHYNSIFASVPSVYSSNEDSILKYGFGVEQLCNVSHKIIKRLKKKSLSTWRDWVLKVQSQPLFYKFIETPSRIYHREKLVNSFAALSRIIYNYLASSILKIQNFSYRKQEFSTKFIVSKVDSLIFKQKNQVFAGIKVNLADCRLKSIKGLRRTKRILAGIRKIKSMFLKRFKLRVQKKVDLLRINSYKNIFRFKVYEKRIIIKVICCYLNSQKKKIVQSFFIWRSKAREKSRIYFKFKAEDEKRKIEIEEASQIEELQGAVNDKARNIIEGQIESLLYSFAIDSFNGFLNL